VGRRWKNLSKNFSIEREERAVARCLTTAVGGWRCARVSGAATREAETILEKMRRDTTLAHVIRTRSLRLMTAGFVNNFG
jgi:phosphoserine phosphatase